MLELRNVSYRIDNRQIINSINLKIKAGETIAIVGPSGSGKSTLLRLINNLISPTEGELYFNNQAYENINPEKLRMEISYLLQESDLFDSTIGDNLAFPAQIRNDKFNRKRAKSLLKSVGLGHYSFDTSVNLSITPACRIFTVSFSTWKCWYLLFICLCHRRLLNGKQTNRPYTYKKKQRVPIQYLFHCSTYPPFNPSIWFLKY